MHFKDNYGDEPILNATKQKRVCEVLTEEYKSLKPNLNIEYISHLANASERTVNRIYNDIGIKI